MEFYCCKVNIILITNVLLFLAQNLGQDTEIPLIPTMPTHSLPIISIVHQSGTFVSNDVAALTCHNHTQSTVDITLGVVYSMGLDKCIRHIIHHYGITESLFTALKIFYTSWTDQITSGTTVMLGWSQL